MICGACASVLIRAPGRLPKLRFKLNPKIFIRFVQVNCRKTRSAQLPRLRNVEMLQEWDSRELRGSSSLQISAATPLRHNRSGLDAVPRRLLPQRFRPEPIAMAVARLAGETNISAA